MGSRVVMLDAAIVRHKKISAAFDIKIMFRPELAVQCHTPRILLSSQFFALVMSTRNLYSTLACPYSSWSAKRIQSHPVVLHTAQIHKRLWPACWSVIDP